MKCCCGKPTMPNCCCKKDMVLGPTGPVGPAGRTGATGPTGPRGATGPVGPAGGEISVRSTTTLDPGEKARVEHTLSEGVSILDFYIPKGDIGRSETVRVGNIFTVDPPECAEVTDRYFEGVHYLDFKIPHGVEGAEGPRGEKGDQGERGEKGQKGEKGDRGEPGTSEIASAFVFSYAQDNFPAAGLEVFSNERLPLMELDFNVDGIATLESDVGLIQFNKTGVYQVSFTTSAYVKKDGQDFDPTTDFVAIGFREVGTDNVVAATNSWNMSECAQNVFGQGMFVVGDTSAKYELVNLQKKSVYIYGCQRSQTISSSIKSTPLVSLIVTRIKQIDY